MAKDFTKYKFEDWKKGIAKSIPILVSTNFFNMFNIIYYESIMNQI